MSKEKIPAYRGTDPYLFVSYAHADGSDVMNAIEALCAKGYRVWYDEGIEAGSDWAQKIGTSLENAAGVLFFASENSVKSPNVQRELSFAKEHSIPVLTAKMGEFKMPEELSRMLLVDQMADLGKFKTYGAFVDGIKGALDRTGANSGETKEYADKPIVFESRKKSKKAAVTAVIVIAAIAAVAFGAYSALFRNVPAVVGLSQQEAQQKVEDAGFGCTVSYNYSDEYEYGVIFEQSAEGRSLKMVPVVIKQSIGPEEDLTDVPDTVGQDVSAGAAMLLDAGITKFRVTPDDRSQGAKINSITAQSIPAGLRVSRNNVMGLDVKTDGQDIVFELNGKTFTISGSEEVLIDFDELPDAGPQEPLVLEGADGVMEAYNAEGLKEWLSPERDDSSYSIRLARDMTLKDPDYIRTLARIIVPSGVTLTIDSGARCVCMLLVERGGTVVVKSGGHLMTTMAGPEAFFNYGTIDVQPGGTIYSNMGGNINNMGGARFNLDGSFICGGYRDDDEHNNEIHVWFNNSGTVTGGGHAGVWIAVFNGEPTEDEMAEAIGILSGRLGGGISVSKGDPVDM